MRAVFLAMLVTACSSTPPASEPATELTFDPAGEFFDAPYPSDARLLDGKPDLRKAPVPFEGGVVTPMRDAAMQRRGFPVAPVGYFRFTRPIAAQDDKTVIPADKGSKVLLVDLEKKTLLPTVATTPPVDPYVPENLLAVAPRPGFVLAPNRKHAFVIMRSLGDAEGKPLGTSTMAAHESDPLYVPLYAALKEMGVDTKEIAAATVFTTGDVVADLYELSTKMKDKYQVEIRDLKVDPDDGAKHDRFCEIHAKVTFPQFQRGKPPFNTEGLFDFSDGGLPAKQRDEEALVAITLPKKPMPEKGYPLVVYFHGSGGEFSSLVDRGPKNQEKGHGPAYVVAEHGFAMAGSALPLNPERYPGATETEYLNFNNLPAMRDTFRQGVIEQRMLIDALLKLSIPADVVQSCSGMSLPAGQTAYKLDGDPLLAMGQSMGGMYTNMIGAVEPRIKAVAPTGAGGFWTYFILETSLIPNAAGLVGGILLRTYEKLTFMHPALHIAETAWEANDPYVYMPRLAKRPLPDHPVRSIYEPVGKDDSYFPTVLFDAIALAYGHPQAGEVVWPSMQDALKLASLDGLRSFPLKENLTSETGVKYTGAAIQYAPAPGDDGHAIYRDLDQVKYQYGCFFESFRATGTAVVPAPAPLGTPCPR